MNTVGTWIDNLAQTVSQTDPAVIGGGIALFAGAGVLAAWQSWRRLHNARLIEDTPTAKARSAHQGYVELEGVGRLMDGSPIVAPLSGLPCLWYRYRIEEQVVTYYKGRARRRWSTVEKGTSTDTFWLEDETGRVVVDPEGAEVMPRHKDVWMARSRHAGIAKPTPYIMNFLASHYSTNPYRFTEERINPKDPIYVLGLLKNLGSLIAATTVDEEVRGLLREWKRNQDELKRRFDLNQDNRIDAKEWMLVRAQARREILKARREETKNYNDGINIVTRTGDRDRPFLLSAYPQTDLVQRYRIWAGVYVTGFFLLGSAALWLFNVRFG